MRVDASLTFVPLGGNQSLVAGAGVDIASVNVIDLLGLGVGVTADSQNVVIGTPAGALFGTDFGVGGDKQVIQINLGTTALTGTASSTLNVALQMAPDDGTGNPGTYQTIAETGEMTLAQLQALQVQATAGPIRMDWPPNFPADLNPRFARLLFILPAGENFTAGEIYGAFITPVRDDTANKFARKNFVVA